MSHKLTKEVKKSLAEFAKAITAPDYAPGAPGKGLSVQELHERGITSCKGKPLQAGTVYVANHPPAVNHARRLELAYTRGGWPSVEQYLQPFLTKEGAARQAERRRSQALPAAADFAPVAEAADEPVATSAPAEPEVPAGLAFLAAVEDAGGPEALAAEVLSSTPYEQMSPAAQKLVDISVASTEAYLQANIAEVPAGWALARSADGQPVGIFEPLPLTSADEVQTELRTSEPVASCDSTAAAGWMVATAEPREFTKLCQRWEAEADERHRQPRPLAEQEQAAADEFVQVVAEHRAAGTLPAAPALLYARRYDEGTVLPAEATDAQLLGQLYEAGHPAPPADLLPCGPCRGACGICPNN